MSNFDAFPNFNIDYRFNRAGVPISGGQSIVRNEDGDAVPAFNEETPVPSSWDDYTNDGKQGAITAVADDGSGNCRFSAASHGLAAGEFVNIEGTQYDGFKVITNVPDANHFDTADTYVSTDTGTWIRRYGVPVMGEKEVEVVFEYNAGSSPSGYLAVYYAMIDEEMWVKCPDDERAEIDDNNRVFRIDLSALTDGHGGVGMIVIVGEDLSAGFEYDVYVNRVNWGK